LRAIRGAIHVHNHYSLVIFVFTAELVPRGFHALTVASPRREEFHEDVFVRSKHGGIEVFVRGEERGRFGLDEEKGKGQGEYGKKRRERRSHRDGLFRRRHRGDE